MTFGLLERFAGALREADGTIYVAENPDAALKVMESMVVAKGVRTVVRHDFPLARELGIDSFLGSRGVTVVNVDALEPAEAEEVFLKADLGITDADLLIAETGSVVTVTKDERRRLVSALPRVHMVITEEERIVSSLMEAAPFLRSVCSESAEGVVTSFITGPSRTADVEKVITLGVHGPVELHVLVLKKEMKKGGQRTL